MTNWRAAIFDIDGVIAHQDASAANAALGGLRRGLTVDELQSVRHSVAMYPHWVAYSSGRLTSDAYWSAVLAALGLRPDGSLVREIRSIQSRTWWAVLDDDVLALARGLRGRGLLLATLSNSAPEHEGSVAAFAPLFDVMHFSHVTGRRKPEPEAYTALLAEMDTAPRQAVFIDDKQRNVDAARDLGIAAVRFRGARRLADELARLGLPVADQPGAEGGA